MKKIFITSLIMCLSGCYTPSQINTTKAVILSSNSNISNQEIKLSFKIKDIASGIRVKSVDAYLITDKDNPLTSNAYADKLKVQADVVNGVINLTFTDYPTGGPYYAAIQAYDDLKASTTRKNITAFDTNNKQVSVSSNNVTCSSSRILTYSDASNSLNISIGLIPYNNLPVTLTPQNGSNTPTNNITLG